MVQAELGAVAGEAQEVGEAQASAADLDEDWAVDSVVDLEVDTVMESVVDTVVVTPVPNSHTTKLSLPPSL